MSNITQRHQSETAISQPPQGGTHAPAGRRFPRLSGTWAIAGVLIVMLLVIGVPMGYLVINWVQKVTSTPGKISAAVSDFAAEAIRPKVTMNEVVYTAVQELNKESKLVVFTTVINTDVTREESVASWGVYWGTNVARVSIRGARAQYTIDLSKLSRSDFIYSEGSKELTLRIPKPKLDTRMISIDPAQIQTLDLRGGWARWDKHDTREHAIAQLRPKVIIQASSTFIRHMADEAGIEALNNFLKPIAATIGQDNIILRIEYDTAKPEVEKSKNVLASKE